MPASGRQARCPSLAETAPRESVDIALSCRTSSAFNSHRFFAREGCPRHCATVIYNEDPLWAVLAMRDKPWDGFLVLGFFSAWMLCDARRASR